MINASQVALANSRREIAFTRLLIEHWPKEAAESQLAADQAAYAAELARQAACPPGEPDRMPEQTGAPSTSASPFFQAVERDSASRDVVVVGGMPPEGNANHVEPAPESAPVSEDTAASLAGTGDLLAGAGQPPEEGVPPSTAT
eukprot:COSAG01_NODE_12576_length_1717_cov_1.589617_1_plen_144_part_00